MTIKAKRNSGGFSIIELIVAIALMLMITGILFQAFNNANQVGRKTAGWMEVYQNARALFDFMERDLAGATLAGRNSDDADWKYFQVWDNDTGYPDELDVAHPQDSLMFLTRTMNPGYAKLIEVGYHLDPVLDAAGDTKASDTRKSKLKRYIDYVSNDALGNGDDLIISDLNVGSGDTVWDAYKSFDVIANGVTDLKLEYMDGSNGTWRPDSEWTDWTNLPTTDELGEGKLPELVKITVYITDSNGIFLTGNTTAKPFCGKGIKFVYIARVGRD